MDAGEHAADSMAPITCRPWWRGGGEPSPVEHVAKEAMFVYGRGCAWLMEACWEADPLCEPDQQQRIANVKSTSVSPVV